MAEEYKRKKYKAVRILKRNPTMFLVEGLDCVYTLGRNFPFNGAGALLYNSNEDDSVDMCLYLSYREDDDVHTARMEFVPLCDPDGNHVVIDCDELVQTPYCFVDSRMSRHYSNDIPDCVTITLFDKEQKYLNDTEDALRAYFNKKPNKRK